MCQCHVLFVPSCLHVCGNAFAVISICKTIMLQLCFDMQCYSHVCIYIYIYVYIDGHVCIYIYMSRKQRLWHPGRPHRAYSMLEKYKETNQCRKKVAVAGLLDTTRVTPPTQPKI